MGPTHFAGIKGMVILRDFSVVREVWVGVILVNHHP